MIGTSHRAVDLGTRALAALALVALAACGPDSDDEAPDAAGNNTIDAAQSIDASAADAGAPDATPGPDADTTPDAVPADARPPDAAPVDANLNATILSVDYPVIAHGGQLVVTGINLAGATEVTIGGVSHTNLANVSDTSVTVLAVDDTVPVGLTQAVTVTTPTQTSAAFDVTVIHLTINEVEADSPGADDHEFVELDTGLASSVSLAGYVLVFYNGAASGTPSLAGRVYLKIDLAEGSAVTRANGLMVIGEQGIPTTPDITFNGSVQQGEDAVAIYQFAGALGSFPDDYGTAGNTGLIDAVVYESNADTDQATIRPLVNDDTVIDEGATTAARETVSIQRCPSDVERRKGASFRLEVPTPGIPNVNCGGVAALPACTIDFSTTCPNAVPGACGAIFVAHGAGAQCHTIGVPACYGSGTSFHTLAADNRLDIYLTGNVNSLNTFLSPYMGTDATMKFYTLDGTEVGTPLQVTTDCNVGTPPASNTADVGGGAVRRITVTGDADIWVDNFQVNP